MALTDTAVRNANPGSKTPRHYDVRGLYLEVTPRGGKWWRFKYRFDSKEIRLSLGVYPDDSLKDARNRRDVNRRLIADGIDPGEFRKQLPSVKADRSANSFEIVAREWYTRYTPTCPPHASKIIQRLDVISLI